jgi:hypothetical protein
MAARTLATLGLVASILAISHAARAQPTDPLERATDELDQCAADTAEQSAGFFKTVGDLLKYYIRTCADQITEARYQCNHQTIVSRDFCWQAMDKGGIALLIGKLGTLGYGAADGKIPLDALSGPAATDLAIADQTPIIKVTPWTNEQFMRTMKQSMPLPGPVRQ